jgi:hypothetical protein
MFRVLEAKEKTDLVVAQFDRCQMSIALSLAMGNGRERVELLQEQLAELTGAYSGWLDGRGGGDLNAEIKALLSEYENQVKSLATMRTLYNQL